MQNVKHGKNDSDVKIISCIHVFLVPLLVASLANIVKFLFSTRSLKGFNSAFNLLI
jgi:hypothetical protein